MANNNNLPDTQLAKIIAPNISDPTYTSKLSDAFEIINENFRKLASAPFLQGVKGDSYRLQEYPIWENSSGTWKLTQEGAILLNSIFTGDGIGVFKNGYTYTKCLSEANNIVETIGEHSSLSCFFDESGNPVNNYVFFQEIIDDANEQVSGSKTYGQLFYFVDGRLKDAGSSLENETYKIALSQFCDLSGFYQFDNTDVEHPKYIKLSLMPSIYYDADQDNICWMFNGIKTGISAVGATGKSGKDATLKYVQISLETTENITQHTNEPVIAIAKIESNIGFSWETDTTKFDDLLQEDDNVLIFIKYEKTEMENNVEVEKEYYHFVFGKVYNANGTWKATFDASAVIEDVVTFQAIDDYLANLGYHNTTTPLRQYIEIPISPVISADLGKHNIGTCYKNGEPTDSNNGSFIVHRQPNVDGENANLEKQFIISGYDNLLIKKHNITPNTGIVVEDAQSNSVNLNIKGNSVYGAGITFHNAGVGEDASIMYEQSEPKLHINARETIISGDAFIKGKYLYMTNIAPEIRAKNNLDIKNIDSGNITLTVDGDIVANNNNDIKATKDVIANNNAIVKNNIEFKVNLDSNYEHAINVLGQSNIPGGVDSKLNIVAKNTEHSGNIILPKFDTYTQAWERRFNIGLAEEITSKETIQNRSALYINYQDLMSPPNENKNYCGNGIIKVDCAGTEQEDEWHDLIIYNAPKHAIFKMIVFVDNSGSNRDIDRLTFWVRGDKRKNGDWDGITYPPYTNGDEGAYIFRVKVIPSRATRQYEFLIATDRVGVGHKLMGSVVIPDGQNWVYNL